VTFLVLRAHNFVDRLRSHLTSSPPKMCGSIREREVNKHSQYLLDRFCIGR
jgi:hypothetical protein